MKLIILLTCFIFTIFTNNVKSHSETMNIKWSAVTQYTNNVEIKSGELTHYNLYCNDNDAIKLASPTITYSVILPHGTYNCYVTAVVTIAGFEYESASSDTVTKIIEGDVNLNPKPPIISLH